MASLTRLCSDFMCAACNKGSTQLYLVHHLVSQMHRAAAVWLSQTHPHCPLHPQVGSAACTSGYKSRGQLGLVRQWQKEDRTTESLSTYQRHSCIAQMTQSMECRAFYVERMGNNTWRTLSVTAAMHTQYHRLDICTYAFWEFVYGNVLKWCSDAGYVIQPCFSVALA